MAIIINTNSYVSIVEADAYFEERLDSATWTASAAPVKEKALISASRLLNELSWVGTAVSELQALAFPRDGEYFDPRIGCLLVLAGVPNRIKNATFELAIHLLNNEGILTESGGVTDISVTGINLTNIHTASLVPPLVKVLINPLLKGGGSRAVWRVQ